MTNKRRQRFLDYFNGPALKGNREALIRRTGLTKGRISQLFDESQAFGERAASSLAQRLGLPSDYFEHEAHEVYYVPWEAPSAPEPRDGTLPAGSYALQTKLGTIEDVELELMLNMRELLPEDREQFMAEIRSRAEQMRKHAALVLERAGVKAPAADARVAQHIKPAPKWEGEERRHEANPVEFDRRRVYYDYDGAPPPSDRKKRGAA
jgi:hypothetical protein